jgi:hypothetical protein
MFEIRIQKFNGFIKSGAVLQYSYMQNRIAVETVSIILT